MALVVAVKLNCSGIYIPSRYLAIKLFYVRQVFFDAVVAALPCRWPHLSDKLITLPFLKTLYTAYNILFADGNGSAALFFQYLQHHVHTKGVGHGQSVCNGCPGVIMFFQFSLLFNASNTGAQLVDCTAVILGGGPLSQPISFISLNAFQIQTVPVPPAAG